jgi:hypothetical protein
MSTYENYVTLKAKVHDLKKGYLLPHIAVGIYKGKGMKQEFVMLILRVNLILLQRTEKITCEPVS